VSVITSDIEFDKACAADARLAACFEIVEVHYDEANENGSVSGLRSGDRGADACDVARARSVRCGGIGDMVVVPNAALTVPESVPSNGVVGGKVDR
jgi:hypothetical protein